MTAVLVYVPGCTVLSELLCVVEADPAVTFAGIRFQQTPLGCALARCLRNNGEHTPASETTGAVVRTGAFADTKTVGGHPNRVRLEGSADGIDSPAILSEHKITGILVRTRFCVTEVTERPLLGCGIRPILAHTIKTSFRCVSRGRIILREVPLLDDTAKLLHIVKARRIAALLDDLHRFLVIRTARQPLIPLPAAVHSTQQISGVVCDGVLKGSIVVECGNALLKNGYKVKILNTINFKKSMHYNPFAYVHSEKDILKLVTALMTNTKGEGSGGDPFWEKSERLLLTALIAYLHYEAPVEEQNFATLLEMLNTMQVLEDDEEYQNPVDLLFEELAKKKPNSFAGRQYKLYKLAAGDICSK